MQVFNGVKNKLQLTIFIGTNKFEMLGVLQ